MPTERFSLESNGYRMLIHMFIVYGNRLRKSDFAHIGCGNFYKRLLREKFIEEIPNEPDPLIIPTERYDKINLNEGFLQERLYS